MEPLWIRLRPSPILVLGLAVIHIGGASCVLVSDIGWPVQVLVCLFLGWSLRSALLRYGFRSNAASVVAVHRLSNGAWDLVYRAGQTERAELLSSFAHPRVAALCFRSPTFGAVPLLILPQMLDDDDFRKLRASLWTAASRAT